MQLCDDFTVLYRPAKDEILNTNRVIQEFNVHPKNMALARAIVGDKSDNLPGVPGVGFGRITKNFSFLSESKDYTVQDFISKVEEINEKKTNRALQSILEHKQKIFENYRIMQLYNPSISYQSKQEIEYCLANNEKHYNMTKFRLMLAEDGFMTYKWDVLETTMKRISQ